MLEQNFSIEWRIDVGFALSPIIASLNFKRKCIMNADCWITLLKFNEEAETKLLKLEEANH